MNALLSLAAARVNLGPVCMIFRKSSKRSASARRLRLERLEDRRVLAGPEATGGPIADWDVTQLEDIEISASTEHKPQSKAWFHDDHWWTVLAQDSGTWLHKLEGTDWQQVLRVSGETDIYADVKASGELAHVLLFDGGSSQLATLEYFSELGRYAPSTARPEPIDVNLGSGVEVATIDVDSTGRLWLAYDTRSTVEVRYLDTGADAFSSAITIASGITGDDISAITALPNGSVGVLWSDQNREEYGFRVHLDTADPTTWLANEVPADESAKSIGGGIADDHLNVAVGSDGTLYAAVKTGYDTRGEPLVGLLVRRPSGEWDPLHMVDDYGTRPIVMLNELEGRVVVAYTDRTGGGSIVFRESSLDTINFGAKQTILGGNYDDATSLKGTFESELLVIASRGDTAYSRLLSKGDVSQTPEPTTPTPEPPSDPPADDPITVRFQDGVSGYSGTRDTKITASSENSSFGGSSDLEVDGKPDKAALLAWDLTSIPSGSKVTSASISLNVFNKSSHTYSLHELTQAWQESEATWRQASSGTSWQEAGAQGANDRGSSSLGQLIATSTGSRTIQLNSAGLAAVQSWIDNPLTNHGVIVQNYSSASDGADFSSREASQPSARPAFTITYSPPNGTEPTSPSIPPLPPAEPPAENEPAPSTPGVVWATVETENISSADDPAIWVHPTDSSLSRIIGTDKHSSNGLSVYDLAGNKIQTVPAGKTNNVDLRYGFTLSGQLVDIVAASSRTNDNIVIYKVDSATGQLEDVAARTIKTGISVYGFSMYHSAASGKFYAIVNSKSGEVEQWELFDNGGGKVDAKLVRNFDVGSQVEGMVADDELGHLYVGEETVGIWKYGAEPDSGTARTQVDTTGAGGQLTADVEGLTIYYGSDGTGYLLASSQGSNGFVVYRREGTNEYVGTFRIAAGNGIDEVSDTDGIDVTNVPLGPAFPQGTFIAQDNDENFKLVPWQSVAQSIEPHLTVDTEWNPRGDVDPNVPGPPPVEEPTPEPPAPEPPPIEEPPPEPPAPEPPPEENPTPDPPSNQPVTTVFQDGPKYDGTRDTKLVSGSPNSVFGHASDLEIDGSPDKSVLIKWNVESVAAGSQVNAASITLDVTNKSSSTYGLYEMLRPWTEDTANWGQFGTSSPWSENGAAGNGDRGEQTLGTMKASSTGAYTIDLNAAGLAVVQRWVDDPSTNHGIVFQDYHNASDGADFHSREASNPADRPRLEITYTSQEAGEQPPAADTPPAEPNPEAPPAVNTPPDATDNPHSENGLLGHWLLDSNGAELVDASTNRNDAAVVGNPQSISGPRGGALLLDGNDYAVVPNEAGLNVTDSITIATWIRPEQVKTQYVIKKAISDSVDGYELSLSSRGTVFVRFNRDSSGNDYRLDSNSKYPKTGSDWMHIAATYNGSTIRMYVNGELETSKSANVEVAANDLDLHLGSGVDGYRSFVGGLDDIRIYDRALSAEEVRTLAESP